MSEELKRCPFCGCSGINLAFPRLVEGKMAAVVECFTDGCYAKVTAATESDAILAWNRRSDSSQARLSEAVKVLEGVCAIDAGRAEWNAARQFLATLGEESPDE